MTWVITANSSYCHIYNYDKLSNELTLIKEIAHPENRLKNSEVLTTDKPGHYNHGAFAPHNDPKEIEIDNFSREIARELDQGRNTNLYTKLIIIAPPHMSGLIYQHLNKHVKELITNNIQKDIPNIKNHELLSLLKTNAQYPDSP